MRSPCPGLSLRRTEAGHPVVRLHYKALSYATPQWIETQRKRYTSQAYWNLEMEIAYEALSGQRVYQEFDMATHVIPDSKVPKHGCRYMAIDPHPRTPHAFLWVLIDGFSDWYVYRELWPSIVCGQPRNIRDDEVDNQFTIREYCETLAVLEGNEIEWRNAETDDEYGIYRRGGQGERIIDRYMDQAGKGFYASTDTALQETYARRYDRFGIQCSDPYKSHKSGEDAVHSLLKPRQHDVRGVWPRLHVAESCKELIIEFMKYRYKLLPKGKGEERELRQEGVEARCHLLDNLRYLATASIAYIPSLVS